MSQAKQSLIGKLEKRIEELKREKILSIIKEKDELVNSIVDEIVKTKALPSNLEAQEASLKEKRKRTEERLIELGLK